MANLKAQQQALETANSNIEQGLLLKEGSEQLKDAVGALDEIDLSSAVDTMQEAAGKVEEHNEMLSEPIFGGSNTLIEQDEVDTELDALMQEQALEFPDAPKTTPVKATTTTAGAASVTSGN